MTPGDATYLAQQRADLLRFAAGARTPRGFGWLNRDGSLDSSRPVQLYITSRMTHVAALGSLVAEPPAPGGPDADHLRELAAHGVRSLAGPLHDDRHGGWFATVSDEGVVDPSKEAYGHAFVVLSATSAAHAGVDGADALLDEALQVSSDRFWDDDEGLSVDRWDRAWSELEPYRGANANMHTVEAYLAAGDATGEVAWYRRADRIVEHALSWARPNQWRMPEHFDEDWRPLFDYNRSRPADPFRPYGFTIGHGFEWSRLVLATDVALSSSGGDARTASAVALYDRALEDGWAADGAPGFVYTTDWEGTPVVRERMHWVLAEALAAAEALRRATGEERFADDALTWWAYADRHFVDHDRGSWHHELDPSNRPSATVWPGKPDVYHAYQASLAPLLPTAPSFAAASRGFRRDDRSRH
ncbi:MAG: AGE family epimerase/isomerase [Nitriliruptorales bacterium]|nr:AGE family epimerase/isomerase [Nitriliruptorales bacterium]